MSTPATAQPVAQPAAQREVGFERFTERQAAAWPEAIAEIKAHGEVPRHPRDWTIDYAEETRPGRGHLINATYVDGEVFAQIVMDVYGYPTVSVARVELIHSSADEECPCGHADPSSTTTASPTTALTTALTTDRRV